MRLVTVRAPGADPRPLLAAYRARTDGPGLGPVNEGRMDTRTKTRRGQGSVPLAPWILAGGRQSRAAHQYEALPRPVPSQVTAAANAVLATVTALRQVPSVNSVLNAFRDLTVRFPANSTCGTG